MTRTFLCAVVGLTAALPTVAADDGIVPAGGRRFVTPGYVAPAPCPSCPPAPVVPYVPPTDPKDPPKDPKDPPKDPKDPTQPQPPNPNQPNPNQPNPEQREAGGLPSESFNANLFGDFPGISYSRLVESTQSVTRTVPVQQVVGFREQVTLDPAGNKIVTQVPIVATVNQTVTRNETVSTRIEGVLPGRYTAVKIGENDSPRPTDRVYLGYNFFDNVNRSLNPTLPTIDQQVQTIGIEKTLLGGDASIQARLPFIQAYGFPGRDANNVGDLTLIGKYAFINDRKTGDVLSAGLALTVPTGTADGVLTNGGTAPHSVLFQPWGGFIKYRGDWFAQGFSSIIVPTEGRDVTLLFNSIGFGYWVFRGRNDNFLTGLVPVMEIHVNTPLSNRDPAGLVFVQDQVNPTFGTYFVFNRATLGTAVNVPVVGPRPWNIEAMVNLNIRY